MCSVINHVSNTLLCFVYFIRFGCYWWMHTHTHTDTTIQKTLWVFFIVQAPRLLNPGHNTEQCIEQYTHVKACIIICVCACECVSQCFVFYSIIFKICLHVCILPLPFLKFAIEQKKARVNTSSIILHISIRKRIAYSYMYCIELKHTAASPLTLLYPSSKHTLAFLYASVIFIFAHTTHTHVKQPRL